MKRIQKLIVSISVLAIVCAACSKSDKKFRLVPSSESGIKFKNTLAFSTEFNILNYMYFYNGGGVAIADFNGDKLPDIYFTSNQESNKLYLNKGDLKFQDITELAGVEGFNGWTTGVTTADVNGDGRLDIYVGYLGDYLIYKGKNQLFINEGNDENGVPKFTDRAMEYGLDLIGFSTQAGFFDYDRDGDLDMFMLNHSLHQQGTFGKSSRRTESHPLAGDKLLRNDNGHFVDVTQQAGIYSSVIGYGLGLALSDVNMDGWIDIYVGNDFHENDYLYLNQGNGTFKESLDLAMNHTSRFSMGVDCADINNDAFPDVISTDMLPEDPQILKSSAAEDPYDVYKFKIGYGYNHQFARNNLQLNNQDGTFSEIALQAGVSSTDWSWSALLADFDLDGHKDIFIANGIPRRPNDLDYTNFMSIDSIRYKTETGLGNDKETIGKMPTIKLSNFLYVNNHDSTFSNKAKEWGLDQPSYSNGVAYADLDNDGDLDLVVNNIEDEAFLFENRTINKGKKVSSSHFIQFELRGKSPNQFGIGTKVLLYDSGTIQLQECIPTRGFQSAVDYPLTFGVKSGGTIDSIKIIWSDGSFQTLDKVKPDQHILAEQQNASGSFDYSVFHKNNSLFVKATDFINIPFRHRENTAFNEFTREQLLPHMMSSEGPASAVADVNGDGKEDVFIGGGKWQGARLYIQNSSNNFIPSKQDVIANDSTFEDVDAVFFDADMDKDNDLFVVSGGNEFSGTSIYRNPRLYVNDGKGNFSRAETMKDIFTTGSCVAVSDVDSDGDLDVFVGSRAIPWKYGIEPDSYLLLNDGKGNFTNATHTNAPDLIKFGFVKDATWADMDGDKDNDLIIAAEWSPVTIFINNKGKLAPLSTEGSGLENTQGWWNVVEAVDVDKDGDLDIIAGNLGLNSKLHTSMEEPVRMYVGDFDKNDSTDQILTHYMRGKEYPFHTRDEMTKQMPYLKKRYLSYHKFAEATASDIFGEQLSKASSFSAVTFKSSVIENLGNGKFKVKPLPGAAQMSTVHAIQSGDFDHDGNTDLLIAGNFYPVNIQMGRYDASYGLLLKGDGKGNFKPVSSVHSGFSVKGEVRALRKVIINAKDYYLTIRNNDTIEAFTLK